jgi:hypothetical protein
VTAPRSDGAPEPAPRVSATAASAARERGATAPKIVLALFLVLPAVTASASVSVQILETDPSSPATLGHWERYDVRVGYDTDRPIRIRGEAFFEGKRVTSITGGSPRYESGRGEALFWFAFTTPARADTILMWAEDERTRQSLARAELSVDLTWTGRAGAASRPRPAWVDRLQAERDRRSKEELDAHMNRPTPWWETLLFFAAVWSIPTYFIVQIVALWRLRGGWRVAAAIPAGPAALVLAHAIVAYSAGSNLFPLWMIFTCPPALIYLLIVLVSRRFLRPAQHAA